MSDAGIAKARPTNQFWLLAALLVLVFLTGGSSRSDVQSLQILRPVAIIVAAYALYTMTAAQWRQYRHLIYILAAVIGLLICHLIPLPPGTWQPLPGREIVRDIDLLLALGDQWRPLSMVPAGTMNALYSLSVPVAVFGLAVQLGLHDQVRLLLLLITLAIVTGTLGLLQAIGINVQFYELASNNAGLFANRNHQSVLLAILFPMLAVAAMWGEVIVSRRLATILAGGLAVIAVPLILVTGSRAGLVASFLAILLIPVIGLKRRRAPTSQKNRLLSAGRFGLAAATIGVLVWLTVFTSRETVIGRLQQSEDDVRYPIWASIVDMLHIYMPWGSGIGSYVDVYQILEPEALLRPTFSNHAHNEWLEIALTAGLPGLAIVAWAVLLFFYGAWRALRISGLQGAFSRLGLSVIVVLAFASTFDYPVRTPIMASVLAIAAVWAASIKKFGNDDGCR